MTEQRKEKIGIYPGTFDPFTKGHLDVVERALRVVDHLIVAVAAGAHSRKQTLLSTQDRLALARQDLKNLEAQGRIVIHTFSGLLVTTARALNAQILFRGLRAVSDFEYEFQMAAMNRKLAPELETVFLTASEPLQFISSSMVKEIAGLGGEVTPFVSRNTAKFLARKLPAQVIADEPFARKPTVG